MSDGEEIGCPQCGGTVEEHALRATWQPITLVRSADGSAEIAYNDEFDYGDDVRVQGYECADCGATWPDESSLCEAAAAVTVCEECGARNGEHDYSWEHES